MSDSNPFLGKKLADISSLFSKKYNLGFIAVRSKDCNTTASDESGVDVPNSPNSIGEINEGIELVVAADLNDELDQEKPIEVQKSNTELFFDKITSSSVSDHILHYGDVILCVANSDEIEKLRGNRDFFVISTVGRLPKPLDLWNSLAVIIFIAMMILVATERIAMCPAALTVTCVYFIGGWITFDEIPKLVNIRLLIFGFIPDVLYWLAASALISVVYPFDKYP